MRTHVLAVLILAASAAGEDSTLRRAGAEAHVHRDHATQRASASDDGDSDDGGFLDWLLRLFFGSGEDDPRGWYRPLRRPYADGRAAYAWNPPDGALPAAPPPATPGAQLPPTAAPPPAAPGDVAADRPELRAAIARLDALDDDQLASRPAAPWHVAALDTAERGVDIAFRLGVDGARIENDLGRYGIDARALLPWRIEADARANWYHESLSDRDANLWLAGIDVGWRALQFENVAARVGVGARWLHDDGGDEGGGVVSAALDIYPVKPVLIEASVGAGAIGGASLRELRLGAGVVIGEAEIAAGWERIAIGTVPLDGPYLALRWWF